MNQPEHILMQGTRIVTHATLNMGDNDPDPTRGMLIRQEYLDARRPSMGGTIRGWVPGHGGDVYWVQNDDGGKAAYGFWEFELAEPAQRQSEGSGG